MDKTHIALGLGLAVYQRGLSVGFTPAAVQVNEFIEARDEMRLQNLQGSIEKNLTVVNGCQQPISDRRSAFVEDFTFAVHIDAAILILGNVIHYPNEFIGRRQ